MANLVIAMALPETHMSVRRPVVIQVMKDLMTKVLIPKHVNIIFAGYTDGIPVGGSTVEDNGIETSSYGDGDRYTIKATEKPQEGALETLGVNGEDAKPIFIDEDIGVYITPVYQQCQLTIEITYQASDRNSADAWIADMKYRMSKGRDQFVHAATYAYPIPKEYIMILAEIYRLRELKGGYGEDLATYFKNHWIENIRIDSTLDGKHMLYLVGEHQCNILGGYDFTISDLPEFEEKEGSAAHLATMTYKFEYSKPFMAKMHYPLVVHNTLLDAKYRTIQPRFDSYRFYVGDMTSQNERYEFFRWYDGPDVMPLMINYPNFDRWFPVRLPRKVMPVLGSLLTVNETVPTDVCNLSYLGDINFTQLTIDYIQQEPTSVLNYLESPIWVGLYSSASDTYADSSILNISNTLDISTTIDMSIRDTYHILIGIIADLSLLSDTAVDRLLSNPDFCIELLKALAPDLEFVGLVPEISSSGRIKRIDYLKAIQHIKYTHEALKNKHYLSNAWVGNIIVNTHLKR